MRTSEALSWLIVGTIFLFLLLMGSDGRFHVTWADDCIAIVQSEDNKTVRFPYDSAKASCHLERHGDTLVVYPIRRSK